MRYTLYSVNDWLDGEEDLEVSRRESYRALYGTPLELDVPDRRSRWRMSTDAIQNLALVVIVLLALIAVFVWRR